MAGDNNLERASGEEPDEKSTVANANEENYSHKDDERSLAGCAIAAFLFSPVLYVLAIGPAAVLHEKSGLGFLRDAIEAFYHPLIWCMERNDTVLRFIAVYTNFWENLFK